jgi:hypothetical protein
MSFVPSAFRNRRLFTHFFVTASREMLRQWTANCFWLVAIRTLAACYTLLSSAMRRRR